MKKMKKYFNNLISILLLITLSKTLFSYSIQSVFTQIYNTRAWLSKESYSGPGSTVKATEIIRKMEKQSNTKVNIIALTANATVEDKEHCYKVGMDDFLTKPFKRRQLQELLLNWFEVKTKSDKPRNKTSKLDQSVLGEIKLMDETGETLRLVLNEYLRESESIIKDLQEAITLKDAEKIFFYAHSLKSSSGNVGATQLYEYAKSLEAMSKEKKIDSTQAVFDKVKIEYESVTEALQIEINETMPVAA